MASPPPLTVVITVREGLAEIDQVLDALLPQARRSATEVLVVGRVAGPAPAGVRLLPIDDENIFRLRLAGVQHARGEIVAIGEDHAVPRPDWCDAVLRAHAERPDVPAISGCLVNATERTAGARGNFLAFAAPFAPPMPALPRRRPPPVSTLSLKRQAIDELNGRLGHFETVLVPRLHLEGKIGADDRIVMDHHQDHGVLWSMANGFHAARGAYGYLSRDQEPMERLREARWSILNWPRRIVGDVRTAARGQYRRADLAVVALYGAAVGLGGAVGSIAGPGRSPERVA